MRQQIGAILLVAGTCLGSGMIALPLVLANLGLVPALGLMAVIWYFTYYTSLIHLELNLQAGKGVSLGTLGRQFSGKIASYLGFSSIKWLSYALLAAYLYGGSSIFQKLLSTYVGGIYPIRSIATLYAAVAIFVLLLPLKLIDYINSLLFVGLLGVVAFLLTGLATSLEWTHLPLFMPGMTQFSVWRTIIPVMLTSFGFQVIFHILMHYCGPQSLRLKRAFFWGSLLPACVYALWTISILGTLYHHTPAFYQAMQNGTVEVGDLIHALSSIAKWPFIQLLVWWISLLAIITSVLGVGVGLCDSIKDMLLHKIPQAPIRSLTAALITILPAYTIALVIPNAFLTMLGFAGLILVFIAVFLPYYLLKQGHFKHLHYPELRNKSLLKGALLLGGIIVVCEVRNLF